MDLRIFSNSTIPVFPRQTSRAMLLAFQHQFEGYCTHAITINNRIEEFFKVQKDMKDMRQKTRGRIGICILSARYNLSTTHITHRSPVALHTLQTPPQQSGPVV